VTNPEWDYVLNGCRIIEKPNKPAVENAIFYVGGESRPFVAWLSLKSGAVARQSSA